jgi:two-component system response regulator YesN
MTTKSPIKVLIADDESIVRKGLIATVDWARFNMQVVADVPNGQKGLEAFHEHRPEVIITDIVMPELNGIELTKLVKEEAPSTKILLLSCHRDFEYAQQGLRLGVSGYLLKTAFEDEELNFYLQKFQEELMAEQPVEGGHVNQAQEDRTRWEASFYAWLCGFRNEFRTELQARWAEPWAWMEESHRVYLVKSFGDDAAEVPWEELRSQLGVTCESIRCGTDRCYYFIPSKDREAVDALLKDVKSRTLSLHWSAIGPLQGMEDWLGAVTKLHQEAELEKRFELNVNSWPDTITHAIRLVAEDLREPWSVSDVAHRVGLSRSHFSTLFKKVTGENFIELLYRMRLRMAMDLLANTPMTLQSIAEQIGMVDGKYLSKWFKRYCGLTPSQYRAEQKEER